MFVHLKNITFVLENTDSITIDGKYIGDFQLQGLHKEFKRVANKDIALYEYAEHFAIEIHKDANVERHEFDNCMLPKYEIFSRLHNIGDIVNIEIEIVTEENKTEKHSYYLDWGKDEDINNYQKAYISNLKNLYILVNRNKYIQDVFNMDNINDASFCEHRFSLYGYKSGGEV